MSDHPTTGRGEGPSARLEQVQRLGNLGWLEWNLVTDELFWSDQLYVIFGRDHADGPLTLGQFPTVVLPADLPVVEGVVAAALKHGEQVEAQFRARIHGQVRHLRIIGEASTNGAGMPVTLHGIIQDVTAQEASRLKLESIQQQLDTQRRSLAEEQRLAVQLQQVILPPLDDAANLPGLSQVSVRYQPAGDVGRVGGDWYHAKALANGQVLLAIGDVAGHGLAAAATMAKLRHALTGLAITSCDPAQLIGWLNQVLCERRPRAIATALVACYNPADSMLTWAHAGHPTPLLARAGNVAPLPRPDGLLLGVLPDTSYLSLQVRLEPADVLLLFTDGLIEQPGIDLDVGLEAFIRTVSRTLAEHPTESLDSVLSHLEIANLRDDTCILAAQIR